MRCPDRATVETPRGDVVTAPVVECRTDAHATTGAVDLVRVAIAEHTFEYDAAEVSLPQ